MEQVRLGNLGRLFFSRGVNDLIAENTEFSKFIMKSLNRYRNKDWGEMCKEDWEENDFAVENGHRIFASYIQEGLPKIWIITEADRSATIILFPDEY